MRQVSMLGRANRTKEIAMTPPLKRLTLTVFMLVMVLLVPVTPAVAAPVAAAVGNT